MRLHCSVTCFGSNCLENQAVATLIVANSGFLDVVVRTIMLRPVRGLVLQSSTTTPADWMRGFFRPSLFNWWARPAYPFFRFTLDSALVGDDKLAHAQRYRGPLLVLVGADDITTAPAMSRARSAASATPDLLKRLAVPPGSGHDDVLANPEIATIYGAFVRLAAGASTGPQRTHNASC